jgi:putative transposase
MIFHVLNRGNARDPIFLEDADCDAFEMVMAQTMKHVTMRVLGYCLMPNHWHLVLWPLLDGDLGRFMQRLTTTHVRRWHLFSKDSRQRTPLPGNVQVISESERRPPPDGAALCGT